jgi:hypothetical protein
MMIEPQEGQDLSDLLVRAIVERRAELDGLGRSAPDQVIEVSLHYHPGMAKIDLTIRTTKHLPSVRAPRRRASQSAEGLVALDDQAVQTDGAG